MVTKKVLVVDDEEHLRSFVTDLLENEGYMVIACKDTDSGYKRALKSKPDLMILDIQMPQIGGVELCRLLRENVRTKHIPIMMLTVQSSETDKVIGLKIGADDYVTKPFSSKELVARVHALLRRAERKEEAEVLSADGLNMNLESKTVSLKGKELDLRPKEFDLLQIFLKKPNVLLTREYILESVFGCKEMITTRTIDTHMKNLRRSLGRWGKKIETVFGRGFKFMPDEFKR